MVGVGADADALVSVRWTGADPKKSATFATGFLMPGEVEDVEGLEAGVEALLFIFSNADIMLGLSSSATPPGLQFYV